MGRADESIRIYKGGGWGIASNERSNEKVCCVYRIF